jgi:hypothetical protein
LKEVRFVENVRKLRTLRRNISANEEMWYWNNHKDTDNDHINWSVISKTTTWNFWNSWVYAHCLESFSKRKLGAESKYAKTLRREGPVHDSLSR